MLTVGVLYPAANCRMHTITVCFGIVYDHMFVPGIIIYHNVGFLHCPSLSTRAMRRPSSGGMGKENPTFPFYRGLTEY